MQHSSRCFGTILCLAAAVGALSCGDDSGGDGTSCAAVAACGGDPSGTWRSQSVCLPDDFVATLDTPLPAECQRGVAVERATPATTLTLRDGTVSEQGSLTLEWVMNFSDDCIRAAAPGQPSGPETAAAFCASVGDALGGADSPFESSSCSSVGGGCSCEARQVQMIDEADTYTVDGVSVVNAEGERQEFCVNGDELVIMQGGVMGAGVSITYTRAAP